MIRKDVIAPTSIKTPLVSNPCRIVAKPLLLALLTYLTCFAGVVSAQTTFLNEDFEGSSSIPSGWTQSYVSGETDSSWVIANGGVWSVPAAAHGGSRNARFFYTSQTDTKRRLITPSLNTTGYINISLSFWHAQNAYGGFAQDELKIFYSSNGGTSWVQLQHYTDNATEWTRRDVDIPVSGSDIRIAFEGNALWGHGVCVDDVLVTGIPDTYSEVSVAATDAEASEVGPDSGTWTITRTGNTTGAITVNFSLSGDATLGSDYNVSSTSSVSFTAGQTSKVVTLTPIDDAVGSEGFEVVTLTLGSGSGYAVDGSAGSADISIYDDEGYDVNVLIIGSSRDSEDSSAISNAGSAPFPGAGIRDQLDNILSGAGLGGVNVTYIDRSAEGYSTDVFSLSQWFHYPYPQDIETTTRWPNLRGEKGFAWDYVVLIGDPYTMEKMPGLYAQGVAAVGQEVAKGSGETVLLMPWPAASSSSTVAHYKEVVYRAGRTGGYKVAPAALAWEDDGSPTNATRCDYICAASIYSRLWGQSAANSSYNYNNALANSVHAIVTNNIGATQYSGKFSFSHPFLMLGDTRRDVHYSEKGTSTEEDYKQAVGRAMTRARVSYNSGSYNDKYSSNTPEDDGKGWPTGNAMPIAWNHGRKFSEVAKEYVTNTDYWQLGMGFKYQGNTWSMPVADANDNQISGMFSQDVDLAGYMIEAVDPASGQDASARSIPWRHIWALIHQEYPALNPLRDGSGPHVNTDLREAVGTYMYTMYSGRCPLDPMPSPMTSTWFAEKVGYETAWRMGNCTSRAPGFKVMPSSATKLTVTPTTTETMTVQFILPPQSDVIVQVSSSDTSAGIVGPQTLVFTPTNYNVPQSVTVTGVAGASASAPFTVDFGTTSDDPAYNGLSDSWAYTTTRTLTSVTHVDNGTTQYSTPKNFPVTTNLSAPGATSGNTVFAGPNHGSLTWNGPDVVYTPDTDYVGPDGFAYWSLNGSTVTTGYIDIDVIDGFPDGSVRVETTDAEATEAGTTPGTWSIIREGSTAGDLMVYFSIGGTAVPGDYLISDSSPIAIPNGQSSITVTLTPVDDSEREYPETVTLTITADAAYTAITNPASITIMDDDNTAPTAYAGVDKFVTLNSSALWTPAQISPLAWYDASDTDTITLNGSTVSQWADKSGNANHATQDSAGSQPTYDGANNKLTFDGNDILKVANDPFNGLQNFAVVAVQKWNASSTWNNACAAYHGESGNGWQLRQRSSDYTRMTFTRRGPGGGADPSPTATANDSDFIGVGVRQNSADLAIRHNGAVTYSATNDTGNIAYTGTNRSSIGGRYHGDSWSSPAGYLNGDLKEVIIIENATNDDVQDVEGYLAWKWGLEGNLPAGHKHEGGAPGGPSVSVPLDDATVTDLNVGDILSGTWTVVSTPPGANVTFDDENLINATVTLDTIGEYTLRLTGTDGTDTHFDDVVITVGTGGGPIADVDLPAGISLYGYTGENPIDAQAAFQGLIDTDTLSLLRWVNPADGQIKELYYTTFPSASWVNEIGDLTLGQGYVVKTTSTATLSIAGNKSTASVNLDLPSGYSIIGFNKETPMDVQAAFQVLIDADKLELVRWVDPSSGQIKELYYTTFPSAGWVNEIGNLTEGQGYIIKLSAPHTGFALP